MKQPSKYRKLKELQARMGVLNQVLGIVMRLWPVAVFFFTHKWH